jgi:serine/threonine-protein kinase
MPTLQPGDTFQQYVVEHSLGAGLHGEVLAVRHRHTGEPFALKVTHLANRGDANAIRRALTAAKGTHTIDHANVVKVHDLGVEDDGMVWMRMELLKGCTVAALLAWQGRLSPMLALSVAYEACWALEATHSAQIVHRDVKPANLFLVDAGPDHTEVRLLDFSIAKVLPQGIATTVGRAGLGTPAYMGPEHLYGAPAHPCFDIFSLGMTLWHALAGFHPWHAYLADMPALIARQVHDTPPSLVDVAQLPRPVDELVRRAIAKDPAARFASPSAFARAIDDVRGWLVQETTAGRLRMVVPRNEPAVPGPRGPRQEYAPPTVPRPAARPEPPRDTRVIVAQREIAIDPLDVAVTLPLDTAGFAAMMPPRENVPPPLPAALDRKESR